MTAEVRGSPQSDVSVVTTLEPAHELAERALSIRAPDPQDGGRVVVVEESYEAEVRFANNTATTNGVRRRRRVTVVTIAPSGEGWVSGVASRSGTNVIEDVVDQALADAAGASPAADAMPLVQPSDLGKELVNGAGFEEVAEPTSQATLQPILGGLGEMFERADALGRVLAGFACHEVATTYLATSTGIRLRHVQPAGRVELSCRSADRMHSSWAGAGTATFSDVALHELEGRVARGLDWSRRRVELPAGRYETILPPDAVADLVVMLSEAASGKEAEDGRTVFAGRDGRSAVGERLSELAFELRSDPREPALECSPFLVTGSSDADESVFDNGLPLERTAWIAGGVLKQLRYSRAGAARSGVLPAPPVDNLVLEVPGATASLDDLVSRTQRGLLLTCLWYIREVDPATLLLTGLTRDGVYLVEGGEVIGAVNNFRFNESPVALLARSTEVGRTERALSREWGEWSTRTAMPSLRVADFNMSTVSPAT